MKIKYIQGMRPTAMLAFYNEPNEECFQGQINSAKEELSLIYESNFQKEGEHFWNPGSYIIIEDNEIVGAHVISYFPHFLYLMRTLNRPLIIELSDDEWTTFEEDFNQLADEFKVLG